MIYQKIREELKNSMKEKNQLKSDTLKGLLAAFTNEAVANGKTPKDELTDDEALVVIKRAVKQRKDSIEQFKKGGREDLAESEEKELQILNEYLPQMLGEEEIKKVAVQKKEELKVEDKSKIGILIGAVMKELEGQADGGDVKRIVESLF